MAEVPTVEQLYESGQKLAEPKDDVSKLEADYRLIVKGAEGDSKTKQLAAQFIPKFFKAFPGVQLAAMSAQLDLCEDEEFPVRVQAIRGLPQIAKEVPEYLQKSADILTQLLQANEALELEAVKKALMTILRLDAKTTLEAIFHNLDNADIDLKPLVHQFLKEKVFPTRQEWMKASSKVELEQALSRLVTQALSNAGPGEVREFLELLLGLDLYAAPGGKEHVQGLLDAVAKRAGQQDAVDVSNEEALQNLAAYTSAAAPLFKAGGTSSSLVQQLTRTVLPSFDKISATSQLPFLKALADTSPYVTGSDARTALPVLLDVVKKLLPRRKDTASVVEDSQYFASVEAVLFTFHQLANKVPNATNPLCGYKMVTGQPSDRLNEDFTPQYSEFTERLAVLEERTKKQQKALTEAAQKTSKEAKDAKDSAAKKDLEAKSKEQEASLKSLKTVMALTKPLHARTPKFISQPWVLSWHDAPAPSSGTKRTGEDTVGAPSKRPATGPTPAAGRGSQNGAQRGRGRGGATVGGGRGGQAGAAGGNYGGRGRGGNRGRGRGGRGRY